MAWNLTCADCGEMMSRGPNHLPQGVARCRRCRQENIPHGTLLGYGRHKRRGDRPCDPCREAWNEDCRERGKRRRAEGYKRPPRTKTFTGTCRHCGQTFSAEQAQPFCSHTCHGLSKRRPRELVYVGPAAPPPHRLGVVPVLDLTPRRPRVWCSGPCAWCGDNFTIIDQRSARYCSSQCAGAAGRRKYEPYRFRISPLERLAIYERDGWVCQLCFGPVVKYGYHLDDWSPTLDHIEPQSLALIPDHTPRNLRTAHRWCNVSRGNGEFTAEMAEGARVRASSQAGSFGRSAGDVAGAAGPPRDLDRPVRVHAGSGGPVGAPSVGPSGDRRDRASAAGG